MTSAIRADRAARSTTSQLGLRAPDSESWRGWHGERVFESIEGDLRLSASYLGSRVLIRVLVWESTQLHGWRAESGLAIEPGEQLTRIANELSALVDHEVGR